MNDVLDEVKRILQKINEWWDAKQKRTQTAILSIALIITLVFIPSLFLISIVGMVGVQRILYHNKVFINEDIKSK